MTLTDGSILFMNPYDFHPCFSGCNEEHEHIIPQYELVGLTKEETDRQVLEQDLEYIRKLRNQKLLECDWTQGLDAPLSEESKAAWKKYRQLLRDMTDGYQLGDDIIWPAKPE